MHSEKRFNGKGDIYEKARPSYASALFDFMETALKIPEGAVFADIGAGTGIFSEQLLNRGYRVYAVEPNADMRRKAEEKAFGRANFVCVNGTDANTALPDQSADCVCAAQAFHWFDAAAFKKECRRILKPGGKVMIVYNSRSESVECTRRLADIHRKYCPEFQGFSKGMNDEKCRAFFGGECEVFKTDNSTVYDRQGFVNRALSSSYSLREGDAKYFEYLAQLGNLFDELCANGELTVQTDTVAYIGSV